MGRREVQTSPQLTESLTAPFQAATPCWAHSSCYSQHLDLASTSFCLLVIFSCYPFSLEYLSSLSSLPPSAHSQQILFILQNGSTFKFLKMSCPLQPLHQGNYTPFFVLYLYLYSPSPCSQFCVPLHISFVNLSPA